MQFPPKGDKARLEKPLFIPRRRAESSGWALSKTKPSRLSKRGRRPHPLTRIELSRAELQAPSLALTALRCIGSQTGFCHDFTQGSQRTGFGLQLAQGLEQGKAACGPRDSGLRTPPPERTDPSHRIVSARRPLQQRPEAVIGFLSPSSSQSLASNAKGAVGAFTWLS